MQAYLIYTANGDIYQRTEETVFDDLADHMDYALDLGLPDSIRVERWVRESELEDNRPPNETLNGFMSVCDWAMQQPDSDGETFHELMTRMAESTTD